MSGRFSAEEAAAWTGGRWQGPVTGPLKGVVQDSRRVEPGMLYVALPGRRVDGHRFLAAAYAAGAAGAMCACGRAEPGGPCLEVTDPEEALRELARGYRNRLNGRILGVTGSAGKTTVKDLLAAMCSARGTTGSTRGNWNNGIGLPLSLLSMGIQDAYGVFELGMNQPGEIADLSAILRPELGLITSIGEAHLEQLGSVEAIAREKASLLAALPPDGVAVLEADSPWRALFESQCRCRVVTCALEGEADIRGEGGRGEDRRLRIQSRDPEADMVLEVPLPGAAMRRNVLQAAAAALVIGVTPEQIQTGLSRFSPAPMRWETLEAGGRQIINDAYNANPLSLRSAVATFAELSGPEEKWLVLGGMAELGAEAERLHREAGRFLDGFRWAGVLLVGPRAQWMGGEIRRSGVYVAGDSREAADVILRESGDGCALLLKGSRSEGLERIPPLLSRPPHEENPI